MRTARWNKTARRCCAARIAVISAFFVLSASFFPAAAAAEGISGYLDLGYSNIRTKTEDVLGNVSQTDSNSISQRYTLTYTKRLAPYLRLYANGLFDRVNTDTKTNGAKSKAELTTIQPTVDLTLRTPVYTAGAKFSRTELTSTFNGSSSTTNINDFYQGILGWKPPDESLPSVEMRLSRTHTYDEERISMDNVSDSAALTMNYSPNNKVSAIYRPTYTDTTNRLNGLEIQTATQSGIVQYSDRFLHDRISVGATYNITYTDVHVSVKGTGAVNISVLPFSGLSSLDDTPADGALTPNTALVDGNTSASAGINIGLPPLGGDVRDRNIGLDFSFAREVNTLLLWVDRPLPAEIANSFSWSIYTSSDNVTWGFFTTVFPAPFGTFDNRFEIAFASVTARYIKVVVKPLSPAVPGASGFPDIFVTELQAFLNKPAEQVRGKLHSSNEVVSLDGRALLRENSPNLYYEVTYLQQKSEPSSQQRWTLANALFAAHRFSRVLTGTARVGREDFVEPPTGDGFAYIVQSSLEAVPLPTLRHTLLYSGRYERLYGNNPQKTTNSYYLNNWAQVYAGVLVQASGGLGFTDQADSHLKSTDLRASANIQPHRTVGLNYQVTSTKTEQSEAGKPEISTRTTVNAAGASYHPSATLYLVFGWIETYDPSMTNRVQNYGLNWSPFLGSSLQFAFTYSESLQSYQHAKSRTMSPSVTWKVTRTASLTAAYEVSNTKSDYGKSDSNTFNTNLRAYF